MNRFLLHWAAKPVVFLLATGPTVWLVLAAAANLLGANPAQALGYKIGQLEISRLRREAEAALGARFDVKKFHRLVLTSGQLPMTVLRSTVLDWVRAEQSK